MIAGSTLIFFWLYILSPLSVTNTLYSVYLLCGIFSLLCMFWHFCFPNRISKKEKRWLLAFSIIFSLAVAVANYELFEDEGTLTKLASYVVMVVGGMAVAFPILRFLLNYRCESRPFLRRSGKYVFWVAFGAISCINLSFLLFSKYPGILTIDSNVTMQQLLGQVPYNNIMPFWHTMTVKVFIELGICLFGNLNSAVAFFHFGQILFMASCFAYAAMTLYEAGVPR